jgi:hypothetical protein
MLQAVSFYRCLQNVLNNFSMILAEPSRERFVKHQGREPGNHYGTTHEKAQSGICNVVTQVLSKEEGFDVWHYSNTCLNQPW